jgi:hypothetical protein
MFGGRARRGFNWGLRQIKKTIKLGLIEKFAFFEKIKSLQNDRGRNQQAKWVARTGRANGQGQNPLL